jgi:hypothetical protein
MPRGLPEVMCGSGQFDWPWVEVEAVTLVPKPKREVPHASSPQRSKPKCAHPETQRVNGKICCAKCGVQLYL